jgi:hypothetical protein
MAHRAARHLKRCVYAPDVHSVRAGASQTEAYVVSSKAAAASVQSIIEGKPAAAVVGDTAKLHADATAKFGSLAGAAAVLDTLK